MAQRRDLRITDLLKHLKPAQVWGLLGAATATLVASAAVGAWLNLRLAGRGAIEASDAECDVFEVAREDEVASLAVALNTEQASEVAACYRKGLYYDANFREGFDLIIKVPRTGWVESVNPDIQMLQLFEKTNNAFARLTTSGCLRRLLGLAHFREIDSDGTRYFLVRFGQPGLNGQVGASVERTESPKR